MDHRWGLQAQPSFQGNYRRRAKRPAFLSFVQLCVTPYCRMLSALQTNASQNQKMNSLSSPEVQRNPLPNHKGKGVAAVIICMDLGEDEEEKPALPTTTITTLQKSSRFKDMFD